MARSRDEFAARILECFADPELRDRLGAPGRRLTEEDYSWDLAGERLDASTSVWSVYRCTRDRWTRRTLECTPHGRGRHDDDLLCRGPSEVLNVCFHGIGAPQRELEVDEEQYWVEVDQFEEMLG